MNWKHVQKRHHSPNDPTPDQAPPDGEHPDSPGAERAPGSRQRRHPQRIALTLLFIADELMDTPAWTSR